MARKDKIHIYVWILRKDEDVKKKSRINSHNGIKDYGEGFLVSSCLHYKYVLMILGFEIKGKV